MAKNHFERIPVEVVKRIATLESSLQQASAQHASAENGRDRYDPNAAPSTPEGDGVATFGSWEAEEIPYPLWQRPLLAALTEFHRDELQAKVAESKAAIYSRLQLISQDEAGHEAERQAIRDAFVLLRTLEGRDLGDPSA